MREKYYIGIDCGSVSIKMVVLNEKYNILWNKYERTDGAPLNKLKDIFKEMVSSPEINHISKFEAIYTTGSGRFVIAELLHGFPINEISTHGMAGGYYYPEANTIIEIGGQDSKLIFLERDKNDTCIVDSQMNDVCAAGTGSFLDQQAYRMGISIEEMALKSCDCEKPAKISGRCSVFAKTDMIHLQQDGASLEEISWGLSLAVARTFIEDLVKGRELKRPILFQGGVANNSGVKRAFMELLHCLEEDIIIPNNFDIMGAIGSVLYGVQKNYIRAITKIEIVEILNKLDVENESHGELKVLFKENIIYCKNQIRCDCEKSEVYIGIDIGSVSVKLVALNKLGELVFKYYKSNNANPLVAVKESFVEFEKSIGKKTIIKGVGVTGSGRDYIAKCISADVVKNEITAQVAGTTSLVNDVDIIIEIGGQDSKYIHLKDNHIKDFVMNKTCAAGTGSFLAEQADRLKIDLKDFSKLAFSSKDPINVGSRCTVFMETDCIHFQQNGTKKEDIIAGLSYSIAKNYIEKVATNKVFDGKIVIQGGIAYNESVVSAFSNLLNKKITIVPHHEVTGAIGIAVVTMKKMSNTHKSNFTGFNIEERILERTSLSCKECPNLCNLTMTKFNDGDKTITGSICGKYDKSNSDITGKATNYFEKRKEKLLSYRKESQERRKTIGIPRMLLFHELFPLWCTYFQELGFEVVLSDEMSNEIYKKAIDKILVDTCYPIRCIYGMVENLKEKKTDHIFLPYILAMYDDSYKTKYAHNCQYIQQVPDLIKVSLEVEILTHTVRLNDSLKNIEKNFVELGLKLNVPIKKAQDAYKKAYDRQRDFEQSCKKLGKIALIEYQAFDRIFILIGHSYILHDSFFNLNIETRLNKIGIPVLSADILPVDEYIKESKGLDLSWKSNNRAVNAVEYIHEYNKSSRNKLLPIFITQFGCAADSMLTPYLKNIMGENPWLEIEVDEHNSITGVLTRCEAFWDSMEEKHKEEDVFIQEENLNPVHTSLSQMKKEDKTLYIYPICEAIEVLPEVLGRFGIKSSMVDKTNDISNDLGRKHSNEKHCRTFQVMVGDFVHLTKKEEFIPDKSVILMFDYDEACRFSLFKSLYYKTLCEEGAKGIEIVSATIDNPIEWLQQFGLKISLELWCGLVCADYLYRYKFQLRPYEKHKGSVDKAYVHAKQCLHDSIRRGSTMVGFKKSMKLLADIEVIPRNLVYIGVTGDAFTRVHEFGMTSIYNTIEEMGGVVMLPPSWNDFISYGSNIRSDRLREQGKNITSMINHISSSFLTIFKKKIENTAVEYSNMFSEPSNIQLTQFSKEYVNKKIAPVIPSMFIGKTVDFVENKNIDGLVNAYGFNCCLGKISTACFHELRVNHNNFPMFTFVDDGLKQTNVRTRVESFMEQTWRYKKRKVVNNVEKY